MPNITGVSAMPRLRIGLSALNARDLGAPARDSRSEASSSSIIAGSGRAVLDRLAVGRDVRAPARKKLALRTSSGSRPRSRAIASITRSIASMPCGPPKPRKAVLETVLVFSRREAMWTSGSQ